MSFNHLIICNYDNDRTNVNLALCTQSRNSIALKFGVFNRNMIEKVMSIEKDTAAIIVQDSLIEYIAYLLSFGLLPY